MTAQITTLIDASFVLAVVGAAMIFPPLGLLVGAAYLAVQAVIADRRASEPET